MNSIALYANRASRAHAQNRPCIGTVGEKIILIRPVSILRHRSSRETEKGKKAIEQDPDGSPSAADAVDATDDDDARRSRVSVGGARDSRTK